MTRPLHPWAVNAQEAMRIQRRLRRQISLTAVRGRIRSVGGGDVAYSKEGDRLFGAMVVLSFPDLAMVDQAWAPGRTAFPYIPGLLSFREGPVLLQVAEKIRQQPDVWIFDGQGIAHPRGLGLASHMGLLLECPSIGCAKERLLGVHDEVGPQRGDLQMLRVDGRVAGGVLRTRQGTKPLYVSPGFRISVRRAIDLVLRTSKTYRTPEPLRQAHLLSNRIRNQMA